MTRKEARDRAELLSVLHYDVRLDLTTGDQTFTSETTVTFKCRKPGAGTFIEFIGPAVSMATLNDRTLPANAFDGGRIRLEGLAADNVLTVAATATYMRDGTGMHRFQDPVDERVYLHSQFAEYATHRVFACFDQPDLKATFAFRVASPADWVVVANTPGAHDDAGNWSFPTTKVMSTYLGAIVAGHYHSVHQDHRGIPLGLYCRQSLAQYLDPDEIFEITRQGLDFFEKRFGYPYVFGKYDQLFVPEFSAGAMENVGCVTHNEYMVHRSKVTEAEHLLRAEIILHEMAHMWFGDLVTMRWWDDLWLNESFATYMSYLAMAEATRFTNAWTEFATGMKAAAKAADQLPTTHPIAADIPDVEALHLNFDRITYEKGASVLKQLVAWVGEEAFFRGVTAYFNRYEFGNTELADFLAVLGEASGRDLKSWSRLWLEEAGVNTLSATVDLRGDSIQKATITQEAPALHPTLRPHRLRVGLFDVKSSRLERRRVVEADVDGVRSELPELSNERVADLILVNDFDLTYTKVKLDPRSLETLKHHLIGLDDPLARALAWSALWDMVRDAQLSVRDYVEISLANIDVETEAAMVESLLGRMFSAIAAYAAPANRVALRSSLVRASRERLARTASGSDLQLQWSNTLIRAARKSDDIAWVRGLLDGKTEMDGLNVDFAVRWRAVKALATIGAAGEDVIAAELHRDPTDEGQRAAASARAARPDPAAKAAAWTAVTGDGALSHAMKRAFASGFHRADQEALLSAYVQPYFDNLLRIWASHQIEEALLFVSGMYPAMVVTEDVVDLTDTWLARDLPGPVRRSLLESQDELKRSLRARAFDQALPKA
ncbi:MAG TPA: aminopeptidase N [Candidatus Dormibacteraeota bacterium]|nr:aminopeptidase N [Candidatus Dormibacteraeota bacterium]